VIVSEGSGTVTLDGLALASPEASQSFDAETTVTLQAIPSAGFRFFQWGGQIVSQKNPITIDIDCGQTVSVIFTRATQVLTMTLRGEGRISPRPGDHSYWQGEQVWIVASPGTGWRFVGWSGAVENPRSGITSVTLKSDMIVTAGFSRVLPIWLIPTAVLSDLLVLASLGWLLFRKDLRRKHA
jgi:hypothetical protein